MKNLEKLILTASIFLSSFFSIDGVATMIKMDTSCEPLVLSGYGSFYEMSDSKFKELLSKPSKDLKDYKWLKGMDPWKLSLLPSVEARKLGLSRQFDMLSIPMLEPFVGQEIATYPEQLPFEKKITVLKEMLTHGYSTMRQDIYPESFDKKANQQYLQANRRLSIDYSIHEFQGICAYYRLENLFFCADSLRRIKSEMTPDSSGSTANGLTAINESLEIMSNQEYEKPLASLAINLLNNLDQPKNFLNRHLDHDLYKSFLRYTKHPGKAEEMTWNTLAVFGARSANMFKLHEFASRKNLRTLLALSVIASTGLLIDILHTDERAGRYTLPANVITSCDDGKSYHFWLTSYLARTETLKTRLKSTSMWAAYISNIGYQMKSETEGRDPARAFFQDSLGVANNKIRLNLATAAAGAKWGSEYVIDSFIKDEKRDILNIARSYERLYKSAESPTPMKELEARKYIVDHPYASFLLWNNIFKPQTALLAL